MADNITITQGSGTTIATKEDGSSVHHSKALLEALNSSSVPMVLAVGEDTPDDVLPIRRPYKSGTALTLSGASSSTPVDLEVSGYNWITIFWDITSISGEWQIIIQGYNPTESNEFDLFEFPAMTATGAISITFPIRCIDKLKLSHVMNSSGSITSTTQYIME